MESIYTWRVFFIAITIAVEVAGYKEYRDCLEGDVKTRCDIKVRCSPEDACQPCKCSFNARLDRLSWACSDEECPIHEFTNLTSYGSSKYLFGLKKKSWNDSVEACKKAGGNLVIINSHEENRILQNKLKSSHKMFRSGDLWLGANENTGGSWTWVDGTSIINPAEDNKWSRLGVWGFWSRYRKGKCMVLEPWSWAMGHEPGHEPGLLKWNKGPCSDRNNFICKIPLVVDDESL